MSGENRELVSRIYDALRNDKMLASYVKRFSKGDTGAARKLFPFVSVGNVRYDVEPVTTAHDLYKYTVEVFGGVRSLVPGAAFDGGGVPGIRGILHLCDDLAIALRGATLGGFLSRPMEILNMGYEPGPDKSGFTAYGAVVFVMEIMRLR